MDATLIAGIVLVVMLLWAAKNFFTSPGPEVPKDFAKRVRRFEEEAEKNRREGGSGF